RCGVLRSHPKCVWLGRPRIVAGPLRAGRRSTDEHRPRGPCRTEPGSTSMLVGYSLPAPGRCVPLALARLALLWAPPARAAAATWPFTPPARPPVPTVKDRAWPRNPVDAFVLARLERGGLRPSPPADPLTLLRRVTFDLTGLAPTPGQVEA